jgi:DtxR family Mn-dependent transcriptional regulator
VSLIFEPSKKSLMTPQTPNPWLALAIFAATVAIGLLFFWPRLGLVPRLVRRRRMTDRVRREDTLKHLFHATAEGSPASVERLAGSMEVPRDRVLALVARLQADGLARPAGHGTVLTDEGRAYALRVLRSHRLVERYLADRTGVRPADWHDVAEEREHALTEAEVDALAARMGHPRYDPHGDPIPTAAGELPESSDLPLSALGPEEAGTVTHLEDEPREMFERLRAAGLDVGKTLVVCAVGESDLEIEVDGRSASLPRVLAPAVSVVPHPGRATTKPWTLADLATGEFGFVARISPVCTGSERRRLLDLGVVPGTEIRAEYSSASGDPVAYRIRGALIALRRTQARTIEIEALGERGAA